MNQLLITQHFIVFYFSFLCTVLNCSILCIFLWNFLQHFYALSLKHFTDVLGLAGIEWSLLRYLLFHYCTYFYFAVVLGFDCFIHIPLFLEIQWPISSNINSVHGVDFIVFRSWIGLNIVDMFIVFNSWMRVWRRRLQELRLSNFLISCKHFMFVINKNHFAFRTKCIVVSFFIIPELRGIRFVGGLALIAFGIIIIFISNIIYLINSASILTFIWVFTTHRLTHSIAVLLLSYICLFFILAHIIIAGVIVTCIRVIVWCLLWVGFCVVSFYFYQLKIITIFWAWRICTWSGHFHINKLFIMTLSFLLN